MKVWDALRLKIYRFRHRHDRFPAIVLVTPRTAMDLAREAKANQAYIVGGPFSIEDVLNEINRGSMTYLDVPLGVTKSGDAP
jgi:hypothetical protein